MTPTGNDPGSVVATSLFGRQPEQTRLRECLAAMDSGMGGSLMISGEPGSGKTALLQAARDIAPASTVLSCRGVEWESELPFSGLHELLSPLLGDLEPLPGSQRDALEATFRWDARADVDALDVYAGALSAVLEATREQPVLLLVDDLQWIDGPTRRALSFLARRISGERVGLIVGTRPGPELPGLAGEPLHLGPLGAEAVGQIAERELGHHLPRDTVSDLTEAVAGNPLAVVECVRRFGADLVRRGTLLDDPLPVGELIERAFAERLDALAPAARDVAELMAASVSDDPAIVLAAIDVAGLDPAAIDQLEEAEIVDDASDRTRFAHPLLRALAHRRATPARLRRWHAALAEATPDPALRAWHAAMGTRGPNARVAAALDAVAEQFLQRGGSRAAAQALVRAATLTPDAADRCDRYARAARAAHLSGRPGWAIELYDAALELADAPTRTSLEHGLMLIESHTQPGADLIDRHLAVANAAGADDVETRASALCSAGVETTIAGAPEHAEEIRSRLRAILRHEHEQLTPAVVNDIGWTVAMLDMVYGGGSEDVETELARVAYACIEVESSYVPPLIEALVWAEEFDAARALLAATRQLAVARGDVFLLVGAVWASVFLTLRTGDWSAARLGIDRATQLTETGEYPALDALVRMLDAWCCALRGEPRPAAMLDQLHDDLLRYGVGSAEVWIGSVCGVEALARRDAASAVAGFERARAWQEAARLIEPSVGAWPSDIVEAYLLAGRTADAEHALAQLRDYERATGRRWARAGIARIDGLLAPSDEIDATFARATELARAASSPFDEARTLLAWGRRLNEQDRRGDATVRLEAALGIFQRLEAVGWIAQVRDLLGADVPGHAPASDRDALTPQERQVAELVAAGASNKEAAGELFLSPKTIEAHLSRIYRKLGVTSRTQLAARFAQSDRAR